MSNKPKDLNVDLPILSANYSYYITFKNNAMYDKKFIGNPIYDENKAEIGIVEEVTKEFVFVRLWDKKIIHDMQEKPVSISFEITR